MRVAVFNIKGFERDFLRAANDGHGHELVFLEPRLTVDTVSLAAGCEAVCAFVNDDLGADVLEAPARRELTVAHVPEYSPHAVAEHCVGLILVLNRNIHRAYNRIRENNFSLSGLL